MAEPQRGQVVPVYPARSGGFHAGSRPLVADRRLTVASEFHDDPEGPAAWLAGIERRAAARVPSALKWLADCLYGLRRFVFPSRKGG